MTEKDLAEDYRMVLHEAKSMGCNKIKALYNIPLKNMEMIVQALEEVQQYHAIGTPEECRAAVEKQIPKKPIMKQYFEDLEDEYLCCPTCGEILTDRIPADNKTFYFHCMNCGQKFDWSDEE